MEKKIILTNHAKEQMQNRDIAFEDIKYALENPSIRLPTKDKKKIKIMNEIPNKSLLKVICRETKKKCIIITVAWGGK